MISASAAIEEAHGDRVQRVHPQTEIQTDHFRTGAEYYGYDRVKSTVRRERL
jgi:hypothetical protein